MSHVVRMVAMLILEMFFSFEVGVLGAFYNVETGKVDFIKTMLLESTDASIKLKNVMDVQLPSLRNDVE